MRVTVQPVEGAVIYVDSDDINEIAGFVLALAGATNGHKPEPKPDAPKRSHKKKPPPPEPVEEVQLTEQLMAVWQWLIDNDHLSPFGASGKVIAAGMDLPLTTINYRLGQLVRKKMIHKPSRGFYRPGTK